MKRLPSTSSIVAPEARLMKSGAPPTAWNARTGLSTPPGSTWRARSKSFLLVFGFRKQSGRVAGEVGDDHVGARAPNRHQRFHHGACFVKPAIGGGGLDHRVFAADLIGRGWLVELHLH